MKTTIVLVAITISITVLCILARVMSDYSKENLELKSRVYEDSLQIAWYRKHFPKWNNYKLVK